MGAAPDQRIFSSEESLRLIREKAEKDQDTFFLKVFRRVSLAAPMSVIASFSGANVTHFTSPELWLPQLAGGGKFNLLAYHETDLNKPIGSFIGFSVDSEEMRDVDLNVAKKPDWRGPLKLEFPAAPSPRNGVADLGPMYDVRTPPAPGSGDSATRTHAWPRQAGGPNQRDNYYDDNFGPRAAGLEVERRRLEQEKMEAEREKHRAELESLKKSHEADMRSLKTDLLGEIRANKPAAPTGPDPLLMEFMKQQAEDRRAAATQASEDRRLERERVERTETRAAEDRRASEARFEKVLEKISERKDNPLELAKQLVELTGKKSNDSDMLVKSVHNMVEMQSSTMGMAMDFVDHVSRMRLGEGGGGESEPGWVKGIDRLMKGIGKMALARPPGVPPQMFPAPAQAVVQGQAQPAQGQQAPPAQPPQGQKPPQAPPAPSETPLSVVDQVEQAIRAHYDASEVAKALIKHYQDPSVQQALGESGGDFEQAFKKRLGNWADIAPQNRVYLTKLIEELERQLQAAGFYADDDTDDKDDGKEETEAEEEAAETEGDEGDDE